MRVSLDLETCMCQEATDLVCSDCHFSWSELETGLQECARCLEGEKRKWTQISTIIPHRIHGAGILMLTWLGYIDGIHVTIYSSTMDPMGTGGWIGIPQLIINQQGFWTLLTCQLKIWGSKDSKGILKSSEPTDLCHPSRRSLFTTVERVAHGNVWNLHGNPPKIATSATGSDKRVSMKLQHGSARDVENPLWWSPPKTFARGSSAGHSIVKGWSSGRDLAPKTVSFSDGRSRWSCGVCATWCIQRAMVKINKLKSCVLVRATGFSWFLVAQISLTNFSWSTESTWIYDVFWFQRLFVFHGWISSLNTKLPETRVQVPWRSLKPSAMRNHVWVWVTTKTDPQTPQQYFVILSIDYIYIRHHQKFCWHVVLGSQCSGVCRKFGQELLLRLSVKSKSLALEAPTLGLPARA